MPNGEILDEHPQKKGKDDVPNALVWFDLISICHSVVLVLHDEG